MTQQPAVGRIVHLRRPDGGCTAALITEVDQDGGIWVTAFPPRFPPQVATAPLPSLPDTEGVARASWHWPEYVPGYDPAAVPPTRIPEPDRDPEHTP